MKRCVFSKDLKHCKDPAHWTVSGSSFHNLGAAATKDRSPYAVNVLTWFSKCLAPDLNDRAGLCSVRSSEMYFGAIPLSALYVNSKTLNTTCLCSSYDCIHHLMVCVYVYLWSEWHVIVPTSVTECISIDNHGICMIAWKDFFIACIN